MKPYIILSLSILVVVFSSCQKEVQIDLNSSDPKLVIEAEINDQPASCNVKLTRTVNFNQSNIFPAAQGAKVTISDNLGNAELLGESSPGIYTSPTLQGIPGRTYTLIISDAGKEYQAVSTLNLPVAIDTLTVEKSFFGNMRFVHVGFTDLQGIENSYRIIKTNNGIVDKTIYVGNDYLQDGHYFEFPLFSEDSVKKGDSVVVALQNIDKGVYDYFRTLEEVSNGDPNNTPANPLSNISNGALGYFNAYAIRKKAIVVP